MLNFATFDTKKSLDVFCVAWILNAIMKSLIALSELENAATQTHKFAHALGGKIMIEMFRQGIEN